MELVEHIFGQSLTIAISSDIVEMLRVCFQYVPDAVSISLPTLGGINLLQLAMFLRREKTFNLLCRMSDACPRMIANALLFESKFTIWHMVAQLPPTGSSQLSHVAGSALQLQRELQWFKVGVSHRF